jgi:hypothetical protein
VRQHICSMRVRRRIYEIDIAHQRQPGQSRQGIRLAWRKDRLTVMPFCPIPRILPPKAAVEDQLVSGLEAIANMETAIISDGRRDKRKFCFGGLRKTQQVGCEGVAGKRVGKPEGFHIGGVSLPVVVGGATDFSAEPDGMASWTAMAAISVCYMMAPLILTGKTYAACDSAVKRVPLCEPRRFPNELMALGN